MDLDTNFPDFLLAESILAKQNGILNFNAITMEVVKVSLLFGLDGYYWLINENTGCLYL